MGNKESSPKPASSSEKVSENSKHDCIENRNTATANNISNEIVQCDKNKQNSEQPSKSTHKVTNLLLHAPAIDPSCHVHISMPQAPENNGDSSEAVQKNFLEKLSDDVERKSIPEISTPRTECTNESENFETKTEKCEIKHSIQAFSNIETNNNIICNLNSEKQFKVKNIDENINSNDLNLHQNNTLSKITGSETAIKEEIMIIDNREITSAQQQDLKTNILPQNIEESRIFLTGDESSVSQNHEHQFIQDNIVNYNASSIQVNSIPCVIQQESIVLQPQSVKCLTEVHDEFPNAPCQNHVSEELNFSSLSSLSEMYSKSPETNETAFVSCDNFESSHSCTADDILCMTDSLDFSDDILKPSTVNLIENQSGVLHQFKNISDISQNANIKVHSYYGDSYIKIPISVENTAQSFFLNAEENLSTSPSNVLNMCEVSFSEDIEFNKCIEKPVEILTPQIKSNSVECIVKELIEKCVIDEIASVQDIDLLNCENTEIFIKNEQEVFSDFHDSKLNVEQSTETNKCNEYDVNASEYKLTDDDEELDSHVIIDDDVNEDDVTDKLLNNDITTALNLTVLQLNTSVTPALQNNDSSEMCIEAVENVHLNSENFELFINADNCSNLSVETPEWKLNQIEISNGGKIINHNDTIMSSSITTNISSAILPFITETTVLENNTNIDIPLDTSTPHQYEKYQLVDEQFAPINNCNNLNVDNQEKEIAVAADKTSAAEIEDMDVLSDKNILESVNLLIPTPNDSCDFSDSVESISNNAMDLFAINAQKEIPYLNIDELYSKKFINISDNSSSNANVCKEELTENSRTHEISEDKNLLSKIFEDSNFTNTMENTFSEHGNDENTNLTLNNTEEMLFDFQDYKFFLKQSMDINNNNDTNNIVCTENENLKDASNGNEFWNNTQEMFDSLIPPTIASEPLLNPVLEINAQKQPKAILMESLTDTVLLQTQENLESKRLDFSPNNFTSENNLLGNCFNFDDNLCCSTCEVSENSPIFDDCSKNNIKVEEVPLPVKNETVEHFNNVQDDIDNLLLQKASFTNACDIIRNSIELGIEFVTSVHTEERAKLIDSIIYRKSLIVERDQALEDLRNVERAFSELLMRYSKAKLILEQMKQNEIYLKQKVEDYEKQTSKKKEEYIMLHMNVDEKLNTVNEEVLKVEKYYETEKATLAAMLRKSEIRLRSLTTTLDQTVKDNSELLRMCKELGYKD